MVGVPALPNPFPIARYRLTAIVERDVRLPPYSGSMLRGAFGHALKHVVCATGAPVCKPCPLFASCQYPAWFETPPPAGARRVYSEIPHPFVIEPPAIGERTAAAGEALSFGMVAFGPALAQVHPAVLAWRRALQAGLGASQGRARLASVHVEDDPAPVFDASRGAWRPHATGMALPAPESAPETIALDFGTPLRIKRAGHVLGANALGAGDVAMALVRRTADVVDMLLGEPLGWDFAGLKRAASGLAGQAQLEWFDWSRYSNRQNRAMPLGGAVGRLVMAGDLRPFWALLHLGQWLHIGGKATFGLGHYRLAAP
jgi:CRISPR/Cas system endoribonuclease Cas6 (RAMP superfamily)